MAVTIRIGGEITAARAILVTVVIAAKATRISDEMNGNSVTIVGSFVSIFAEATIAQPNANARRCVSENAICTAIDARFAAIAATDLGIGFAMLAGVCGEAVQLQGQPHGCPFFIIVPMRE